MNTILVTLPVNGTQKAVLENAGENCRFLYETDSSKTEELIPEADIIIGNVPAGDIHASPKLKLLQLQSAGTDGYTAPGVLSENTILTNATGAYDKTVAEHGLALTLMLQKNFYLYRDLQNQHIWKDMGMAASIADSTVVIVGYGSIGSLYAKMVKALGATVIGVKRRKSEKPEILDELVTMDELDNILPRADVVFSVLPNTPATQLFLSTVGVGTRYQQKFCMMCCKRKSSERRHAMSLSRSPCLLTARCGVLKTLSSRPTQQADFICRTQRIKSSPLPHRISVQSWARMNTVTSSISAQDIKSKADSSYSN